MMGERRLQDVPQHVAGGSDWSENAQLSGGGEGVEERREGGRAEGGREGRIRS